MTDSRQVIPPGEQAIAWLHLIPIAKYLVERGHVPLYHREGYGFGASSSGTLCQLSRCITEEDWEDINREFVIPANVKFYRGIIRDTVNRVDIIGYDQIHMAGVLQPVEVWEERERQEGRL